MFIIGFNLDDTDDKCHFKVNTCEQAYNFTV